ncbi:MAG: glycosyltransferase [Lentisphaerae bacterium]|nr:glycosyltransferase [Lentisphaerota bacterium]
MPQLSIVVPAYNIADWIERCLQSLAQIALPNDECEILVVNDGATDATPALVRKFQEAHPHVRVISQANAGLSAARNTGLEAATGTYVWFVDGDDWILPEAVPGLLQQAQQEHLDILGFGMQAAFEDGRTQAITGASIFDHKVMSGIELVGLAGAIPSACTQFYRREFLLAEQLRFYVGIVHEDQEFTPRAYCLARRMMRVPDVLYVYFQRANSIQRSVNPRKAGDLLTACASLRQFGEERLPGTSPGWDYLDRQIAFCFSQALANYSPGAPGHSIAMFTEHPCYPLRIGRGLHWRLRLKYRLINLSVRLYLWVYCWRKK